MLVTDNGTGSDWVGLFNPTVPVTNYDAGFAVDTLSSE
jgi:hypothetical protein